MRTEQQMLDLILETARGDERIRTVIMNGSRTNPNAPRDFFQDFDIVYIVTDVEPFRRNLEWIKRFGDMMILQMPEDMQDPPPDNGGYFVYLMQFMDSWAFDSVRTSKCSCQHLLPDGVVIPSCGYYSYHRRFDRRFP